MMVPSFSDDLMTGGYGFNFAKHVLGAELDGLLIHLHGQIRSGNGRYARIVIDLVRFEKFSAWSRTVNHDCRQSGNGKHTVRRSFQLGRRR